MKKWYKSKTIIGAGVAIAALLLQRYGFDLGPETQDAVTGAVLELLQVIGTLFAIYGRVKADGKISR